MSIPDNRRPPNQPQAPQGQPNYAQPQYGQPVYPQQPQYGQPQYGQPPYGQPQYGQQMPPQPAQPGYGYPAAPHPTYDQFGQPIYPQQGYPQPAQQPAAPSNDLAWVGPIRTSPTSVTLKASKKSYMEAKGILAFIGIMTILFNGFLFLGRERELDEEISKLIRVEQQAARAQGMEWVIDQGALAAGKAQALTLLTIIYGGFIALGVVFLVLAFMVQSYPVGATAIGLTLYVGATLGVGVFIDINTLKNPVALVMKGFITLALVRAIMSAHAYRREMERLTRSAAR